MKDGCGFVYAQTMGVASYLSAIRGHFQRTSAVGSMQFVQFQSVPQLVSFIGRLSAGGRVRYGRFHCTAVI